MSIRDIFLQTDIAACLKQGIRALNNYSALIEVPDRGEFECSVNIDACLSAQYAQANRWDYAFGYRNRIYYVEIHHLGDSEVSVVIKKLNWLRDWQNQQPDPVSLKNNSEYYWISSGKGSITKYSRYTRMLSAAGLSYPAKRLRIDF